MPGWAILLIGIGVILLLVGIFAILPGEEETSRLRPKWWWHGGPGNGSGGGGV